jgi:hypothetical protein
MTRLAPFSPASQLSNVELGAFLPDVIDAGEAQHVSRYFTGRVVATVLARQIDAGNVQLP